MGGRAAPVWRVYEPKKTVARSARARTLGQNPLVTNKEIIQLSKSKPKKISILCTFKGHQTNNPQLLTLGPTSDTHDTEIMIRIM
jgi:hypothetical protein